ncbi:LysR substrate-binding domain-containing protein [Vibrio genomosp. F6]|uniref:Transcriptional regulator n=1 Tax=Vibrio genomosp. F6 str. FF-238 TaxID=1191298 RepID=A0A1E5D4N9_9VIBR|nr:LysR substrate-binding domain-containing protein [Vibrio genomosp. F6]OEE78520.1 transcriptional regulator [Vibrio genomosp. F6 str. FF-238]
MNKPLPSTKTLQSFLATAHHLNLTHAAKEMNLTQGAISRQIQSLEQHVGIDLFYRHARGLSLTPKGVELVPLIEETISQLKSALSQVSTSPDHIKLNAPSCITSWLLPRLMSFQQAFPDIDVELTSTIKHRFEPNFDPFDAVIVFGQPPRQKALQSDLLFEEKLTPICRPELMTEIEQKKALTPEDFTQFTWLHANAAQSDWAIWLNHVGKTNLQSKQNQHFATLDQAMNAAVQGFGIAVGDITLAEQDLLLGRVVSPHPQTMLSGNGYFLIQPKNRQNHSLSMLVDWLLK